MARAPRLQVRGYGPALAMLAAIPLLTATAAQGLAIRREARNRRIEVADAAPLAARAAAVGAMEMRSRVTPLFERPTLSGVAERLGAALPPGARVHLMAVDPNGSMALEIDCNDPDALRAALRGDRLLGSLRMIGQEPAENGVRVMLRSAA